MINLFRLFFSFFKIGLFAIGGAYSFLPLIEKEIVEKYGWLTKEEFLEVLAIVKIFPGAISIKYATYTGNKVAGLWGILAANIGNFLAPLLLIVFATGLYTKYKEVPSVKSAFSMIQLVAFSLILAVAFQVVDVNQLVRFKNLAVIVAAFALFIYGKVHPAWIILGAGFLGAFLK